MARQPQSARYLPRARNGDSAREQAIPINFRRFTQRPFSKAHLGNTIPVLTGIRRLYIGASQTARAADVSDLDGSGVRLPTTLSTRQKYLRKQTESLQRGERTT